MRQVMGVQHALQDGARAWQADALELGAQEIDGGGACRASVPARRCTLSRALFASRAGLRRARDEAG